MSVPATVGPARSPRPVVPRPATRRPRLRLVPQPARRAPRAPFIAVVILMLGGGLIALLVLNTQRAQGAFAVAKLQARNAQLNDAAQALTMAVQQDQDPTTLAARATALGMTPGGSPVFVNAQGKVVGVAPAGAPLPSATSLRQGDLLIAMPTAAQLAAAKAAALRAAQAKAAEATAAANAAARAKAATTAATTKAASKAPAMPTTTVTP